MDSKIYETLDRDERMLLRVCEELYKNDWDLMKRDLNERLKAKPYIATLIKRIHLDLARIEKLKRMDRV